MSLMCQGKGRVPSASSSSASAPHPPTPARPRALHGLGWCRPLAAAHAAPHAPRDLSVIAAAAPNPSSTPAVSCESTFRREHRGGGGRRQLLLRASLAPLLVQLAIGSDDATTIINSVLSGYGLPTLKASVGYKVWDEFSDEFTFEYPKSWVSRPNSLRKGVYISDFQTADKVSVEVLDAPANGDVQAAAVTAAVLPGGGRLTQDDLLSLPPKNQVKASSAVVDGQEILYLEFPSETITRSGYQIKRRNFVAAAVKRGKLYTIAASARGDQYNEAKREMLQHVVRSFRLR